jgi:hypothetical protein
MLAALGAGVSRLMPKSPASTFLSLTPRLTLGKLDAARTLEDGMGDRDLFDATQLLTDALATHVVLGELVAIADEGRTPLVTYPGQSGTAALQALSVVELNADHVGCRVVLAFERGDPSRPIVMGALCGEGTNWPLAHRPGQVHLSNDGKQMLVSASRQLVLRCGKSRLILDADGHIVLSGESIVCEATGANRIRGGSVQLN